MATIKIGDDTAEIWCGRIKNYTSGNPEEKICDLLRAVLHPIDPSVTDDTPMDVVFELLRDNVNHIVVQGMLMMKFSEMNGKLLADEKAAKVLAAKILAWLKSEKTAKNAEDIEGYCFPGENLKSKPQEDANLSAAYKLLYNEPGIIRLSKDGNVTTTRWTSLQFKPFAK